MLRRTITIGLASLAAYFLSGCSSQVLPTASAPPPAIPSPYPTYAPYPTHTPYPSPSPTAMSQISHACPALLSPIVPPLLQKGSLLFRYSGAPSIWAISAGSAEIAEPQLVFEPPELMHTGASLSPDGMELAWEVYEGSNRSLVVYDLAIRSESRIPWRSTWRSLWGWTSDGRVKLLVNRERQRGVGETWEYAYLDVTTQIVEPVIESIHLPGYRFDDNNPLEGFASVDPSRTLVLYTASGESRIDILLRHLQTGHVIWTTHEQGHGLFPLPDWTADGSRVVFAFAPDDDGYTTLVILTSDGQRLEALTHQPLAESPLANQVRFLDWSPSEQYLYYALYEESISQGPGFILDIATSQIREVCDGSDGTVRSGTWVPGTDLFVFITQSLYGREALEILNAPTWGKQVLVVNEEGSIQFFGWTPIEFPSSVEN